MLPRVVGATLPGTMTGVIHWLLYSGPGIAVLTLAAVAIVGAAVWGAIWVTLAVVAAVLRLAPRERPGVSVTSGRGRRFV
jgi:hypothetical protein